MRVLLDTSFLYDLMAAYGEFSESMRGFAAEHDAEFFVNAVSIWEMRLKYDAFHPSGERKSPYDPNDVLAILQGQDVTFLSVEPHHVARELETPIPHRDPFDQLLLVQAQEEGLRLLTADRQLAAHPLAVTAH
ncbi:MAG: type II toxin-antitoxin system VapC family toxin [Acidobacteriota bacterium]|nr:type II toxin-antitoxin system VapC family toxin [Acidobacteriota bacterium]